MYEKQSYRQIFRATSIFGGTQVITILISIVKQKFIAILLGPAGMGINGLYNSATSLIQGLTSMGLSSSAVRDVAEANGIGDLTRISRVIIVFRRLIWITGLLGMVVVLILSPYLSKFTFGNYDYTIPFIFLSVTLLLAEISAGQSVVLQGMRKLRHLAKASVLGSFFGLIISIPVYYYFRIEGIVPVIILSSITTLLCTWYFSKKINLEKIQITPKQTLLEGKEMLKMGLVMSLDSILVLGIAYIVRIFIVRIGGTEEVGLYAAGFTIVNGYEGLIFTAMGKDYYPRLAEINKDNTKCKEIINQQAEIAILIITPVLMMVLLVTPVVIKALYSNKFIPITGFMQWAIVGTMFKAVSWAIGYEFIAKRDMKVFAINEIISNIYMLVLSLAGYYFMGVTGLGVAYTLSYLIHLFQIFIVSKKRYNFAFISSFSKLYTIQLLLLIPCFLLIYLWKSNFVYIPTIMLTIICGIYSFKGLDKRLEIVQLMEVKRGKWRK